MEKATKIVVPESFAYADRSFEYAAAYRVIRIEAGEYPLREVTITYGEPYAPVYHDGGPYYVIAQLPCETLETRHSGEITAHQYRAYQYQAVVGKPAMYNANYKPAAYFA